MCVWHMQDDDISPGINALPSEPLTVRSIFQSDDNWNRYRFQHRGTIRDVEVKEVEKMLLCKDERNGCIMYQCEDCGEYKIQFFSCNSRICSHCGKRYTDQWANRLGGKMFDVPHRHFVMSIASQLWPILLDDRSLWVLLMDSAITTLHDVLRFKTHQSLVAGAIVVLHPFGRDLRFKPHIHVLLTEGGFDRKGHFVHVWFFPAKAMRKVWQYRVLTRLKEAMEDSEPNRSLIDGLFKTYSQGFYVYLPMASRITSTKEVSRYVGRYVRHPAIANSRISRYDGKTVTFWYEDTKGDRHIVGMSVDEFIGSVIRHIPEPQFKMIRHYGAYCRKWSRKYKHMIGQSSITQRSLADYCPKRQVRCPKCGSLMQVVCYWKKGPPPTWSFGGRIEDWVALSA